MAYGNLVTCVNRSTKDLEGTFDGQTIKLPAGYVEVEGQPGVVVRAKDPETGAPVVIMLPANIATIVRSQNPIMGTQDPLNPAPDEFLIGIENKAVKRKDDISPVEQSEAIELIDRSAIADQDRATKAETVTARGGRKSRASVAVKPRINTGDKADYED